MHHPSALSYHTQPVIREAGPQPAPADTRGAQAGKLLPPHSVISVESSPRCSLPGGETLEPLQKSYLQNKDESYVHTNWNYFDLVGTHLHCHAEKRASSHCNHGTFIQSIFLVPEIVPVVTKLISIILMKAKSFSQSQRSSKTPGAPENGLQEERMANYTVAAPKGSRRRGGSSAPGRYSRNNLRRGGYE